MYIFLNSEIIVDIYAFLKKLRCLAQCNVLDEDGTMAFLSCISRMSLEKNLDLLVEIPRAILLL